MTALIVERSARTRWSGVGIGTILSALVLLLTPVSIGRGQSNLELLEMRAALKVNQQQLVQLQAQLEQANGQKRAAAEAMAQSVQISEEKSFKAAEVREILEASGVDLLSDADSLHSRLLKGARDLHILQQENDRQRNAVHKLSEAFLKYIAATPEAADNVRGEAQEAINKAGQSLRALVDPSQVVSRQLEKSRVVSIEPNLGLVVVNAGRDNGVRVGTPITVRRDDRAIYTALIVDVRDSISGALLQDQLGAINAVEVGDKVFPLATGTNF